jgi:hypothetical protein
VITQLPAARPCDIMALRKGSNCCRASPSRWTTGQSVAGWVQSRIGRSRPRCPHLPNRPITRLAYVTQDQQSYDFIRN